MKRTKMIKKKTTTPPKQAVHAPDKPVLRFSPTAWAKLVRFRDKTGNEIGGFGITGPDDLLFVREFVTVKQEVTAISIKFDDEAVGVFFDEQVDLGRKPEQFARIWAHSHPSSMTEPSAIDEETFKRVFGRCDWAVMFILAGNGKCYARLSFNVGPGGETLIPVRVDYGCEFGPSDHSGWDAEYKTNIRVVDWLGSKEGDDGSPVKNDAGDLALQHDFIDEFENMDPTDRRFVLDEMAARPDLYEQEEEGLFI